MTELTMKQALAEAQRIDPRVTRVRIVEDFPCTVLGKQYIAFCDLSFPPHVWAAEESWDNLFKVIASGGGTDR